MESYILISNLNDFLFCPKSIYFHNLYGKFNESLYQDTPQTAGRMHHKNIDTQQYSSAKRYLQGSPVYSDTLGLCGKIDIFDMDTNTLVERKTLIRHIYDGYLFQVYAQYYCLMEMGYAVEHIALHSLKDNIRHTVPLPDEHWEQRLKDLIESIHAFDPSECGFTQVPEKCNRCIYRNLCDSSSATE